MTYFYTPKPIGLNKDIARHRDKQSEIEDKITMLEAIDSPNERDVAALRVYVHMLGELLESKAQVVSKIGRK